MILKLSLSYVLECWLAQAVRDNSPIYLFASGMFGWDMHYYDLLPGGQGGIVLLYFVTVTIYCLPRIDPIWIPPVINIEVISPSRIEGTNKPNMSFYINHPMADKFLPSQRKYFVFNGNEDEYELIYFLNPQVSSKSTNNRSLCACIFIRADYNTPIRWERYNTRTIRWGQLTFS